MKLPETLIRLMNAQAIELAIWRKSFPVQAIYIGEEARAKSEGREPREIPPIAMGAAKAAGIPVREG